MFQLIINILAMFMMYLGIDSNWLESCLFCDKFTYVFCINAFMCMTQLNNKLFLKC